jgi:hypothetical protein
LVVKSGERREKISKGERVREDRKRDREKEKKENFVNKFFPESNSSPSGTFRICRIMSITPAKKRSVGKVLVETELSDADPAENSTLDILNFNYSTQKVKIRNTTNRLSCTTELPLDDSKPTNQRRGRRQHMEAEFKLEEDLQASEQGNRKFINFNNPEIYFARPPPILVTLL